MNVSVTHDRFLSSCADHDNNAEIGMYVETFDHLRISNERTSAREHDNSAWFIRTKNVNDDDDDDDELSMPFVIACFGMHCRHPDSASNWIMMVSMRIVLVSYSNGIECGRLRLFDNGGEQCRLRALRRSPSDRRPATVHALMMKSSLIAFAFNEL